MDNADSAGISAAETASVTESTSCLDGQSLARTGTQVPPMAKPSSFSDLKRMKMPQLRAVCKAFKIAYSGRVTRQDLLEVATNFFGFSTSGGTVTGGHDVAAAVSSAEKRELPQEIRDAYRKLPSFSHITAGWSVAALVKIPHFTMDAVNEYLLFSPDKSYDGDSLRAYKQLRAYQLFDERHVHDIELNEWQNGSHFFFVRAKCWPSQDTSKSAHKCVICIDRHVAKVYGAYCRCVSGLGEACSHVAAVLFALEDFCARGFRTLRGPTVTEKICKWAKPCGQKVDPVPVASMNLKKASVGGRKRKRWTRSGISRYDPRHPNDHQVVAAALEALEADLRDAIADCGWLRHIYDLKQPDYEAVGTDVLPDETSLDDPVVAFSREVEVDSDDVPVDEQELNALVECVLSRSPEERRKKLFQMVPLDVIGDTEAVGEDKLQQEFDHFVEQQRLTDEQRKAVAEMTRRQGQSSVWLAEHCGRITSSMVHRVAKRKSSTPPDNLVCDIMGYGQAKRLKASDPREHGHRMEPIARDEYLALRHDDDITITEHGLFVDKSWPFLATSTDGLIHEGDSVGVLEIKCPMSEEPVDVLATERKNFCLQFQDGQLQLKRSHAYYLQLQMEMAITGCKWADFVVRSGSTDSPSMYVERVAFNERLWQDVLAKVLAFYKQYVVLELLTRRVQRKVKLLL